MSTNFEDIKTILNRIDGVNVPVQEDDGDERAIAAMKLARDENRKEGFDYPQGGKYGYKAERGSGTGAMGTMQVNVTIHDRETDETMHIKDMNYLELEKGDEQETLAMIWDENRDLIQKEDSDSYELGRLKELSGIEEDDSDYIKQAYMLAVKHHTDGSGDGNINEDIGDLIEDYNEKADKKISPEQIMRISKKYNAGGDYVEVLSAEGIDGKLWLEVAKKKYSQLESAVKEEAVTDGKILSMISDLRDAIMEHPDMENDQKTAVFTAIEEIEQAVQGIYDDYEPFPEEDEMTFEDDDAFYEAFGELGFPEDETELFDAEYRGRKVPLNKPMRGDVKKFKVYVKDPKTGNVKKVNFGQGGSSARKAGQKTMKIRKSNPKARKSFRARHNCANPGPKTKARYWSCRKW